MCSIESLDARPSPLRLEPRAGAGYFLDIIMLYIYIYICIYIYVYIYIYIYIL